MAMPSKLPADCSDMAAYKAGLICSHIVKHMASSMMSRPFIVGMQGPQGSGKTTVTLKVQHELKERGLSSAVFSLDDLYLTHEGLVRVAQENPDNELLKGRGQPGTHDVALGSKILSELKANESGTQIKLPIFDKSLHSGAGDRSKDTCDVSLPLDVVIFEGWCLGFYPLPESELEKQYSSATTEHQTANEHRPFFSRHSLKSLKQINKALEEFLPWYSHIDAFVQLNPDNLHNVFAWRLQAEHAMKASGKTGMTDEQVDGFVSRYMPGYELFSKGVTRKDAPWSGKGLRVNLDRNRDVVSHETF